MDIGFVNPRPTGFGGQVRIANQCQKVHAPPYMTAVTATVVGTSLFLQGLKEGSNISPRTGHTGEENEYPGF